MLITKKQQEVELLRIRLTKEMQVYRNAINEDLKLALVKPLYQKAKATMNELRIAMEEYEKLVTNDMSMYNKNHG